MLRFRSNYFSINGVQNLIFNHGFRQLSLYSTSNSTEVNPNFVNYLVQNLGFSQKQALLTRSKCKRQRCKSDNSLIKKADSVISYLKEIGLQQSHIQNAIIAHPRILIGGVKTKLNYPLNVFLKLGFFKPDVAEVISANSYRIDSYNWINRRPKKVDFANNDVGKTLISKNDAALKLGFCESDVAALVRANPCLDLADLETAIAAAIKALKEIMGRYQVIPILNMLSRRKHSLDVVPNCIVPNVAFLFRCGVPINAIRLCLYWKPHVFVRDTDKFKNIVARVEEVLGVTPKTRGFLVGVEGFSWYDNENIKSKMQVYRSYGWSDSDIVIHLLSSRNVLRMSEDNTKKKLDFLMNELGYEPTYLASKFYLFTASLEEKLVPRHKALEVLKENGLISKDYDLWAVVKYSHSQFLNEFVLPYKEVHEVYSEHTGMSLEMLRSSKPNSTTD